MKVKKRVWFSRDGSVDRVLAWHQGGWSWNLQNPHERHKSKNQLWIPDIMTMLIWDVESRESLEDAGPANLGFAAEDKVCCKA